jgi:hypothetical protein
MDAQGAGAVQRRHPQRWREHLQVRVGAAAARRCIGGGRCGRRGEHHHDQDEMQQRG